MTTANEREHPILDHGFVRLIERWGSDQSIVEAARMSTGKGFLGWGPRCDCTPDDRASVDLDGRSCERCGQPVKPGDEKLLRYLWEHKHATPFEMGGITIEVQAPIFVFREWHRHRVPFGYSEASARYAPLPDVNYLPTVARLMRGGGHLTKQAAAAGQKVLTEEGARAWLDRLAFGYRICQDIYQEGLDLGVPKECARVILPLGRYSKMRATGNLRGWLALLTLRGAPDAQFEFQNYAHVVAGIVAEVFPRTWALFAEGIKWTPTEGVDR